MNILKTYSNDDDKLVKSTFINKTLRTIVQIIDYQLPLGMGAQQQPFPGQYSLTPSPD